MGILKCLGAFILLMIVATLEGRRMVCARS